MVSTAELFAMRCWLCRAWLWRDVGPDAGGAYYCADFERCNQRARDRLHGGQPWRKRIEVERLAKRYR